MSAQPLVEREKRRLHGLHEQTVPPVRASSSSSSWRTLRAAGFSQRTCLPAASARRHRSRCESGVWRRRRRRFQRREIPPGILRPLGPEISRQNRASGRVSGPTPPQEGNRERLQPARSVLPRGRGQLHEADHASFVELGVRHRSSLQPYAFTSFRLPVSARRD